MHKIVIINSYHNSKIKLVFNNVLAFICFVVSLPIFIAITILLKIMDNEPVFFVQNRTGENGKVFKLIKFRTMKGGADKELESLRHLNEADGPVFKILNDPRYTKCGKYLAHTGLDELPQLINVLKGEMSIVGPRPLPLYEANRLTKTQKIRELVKPGITSSWVVSGSHHLTFKKWMELDEGYIKKANLTTDLMILTKTVLIMLKQILKQISSL